MYIKIFYILSSFLSVFLQLCFISLCFYSFSFFISLSLFFLYNFRKPFHVLAMVEDQGWRISSPELVWFFTFLLLILVILVAVKQLIKMSNKTTVSVFSILFKNHNILPFFFVRPIPLLLLHLPFSKYLK